MRNIADTIRNLKEPGYYPLNREMDFFVTRSQINYFRNNREISKVRLKPGFFNESTKRWYCKIEIDKPKK